MLAAAVLSIIETAADTPVVVGIDDLQWLDPSSRAVLSFVARRLRGPLAAKLFVSTKTVEANLSQVYRKLGIRSRAELGRVMGQ